MRPGQTEEKYEKYIRSVIPEMLRDIILLPCRPDDWHYIGNAMLGGRWEMVA